MFSMRGSYLFQETSGLVFQALFSIFCGGYPVFFCENFNEVGHAFDANLFTNFRDCVVGSF